MHDIKAIRADPAAFDAALARRGEAAQAAAILAIDAELRAVQTETQKDLAWRGELSKRIGVAARSGEPVPEALTAEVAQVKARIAEAEEAGRAPEAARTKALLAIPNLPADDVPDGADEHANVLVHERGTKPVFDFPPQEHDTIAARLGYDPDAASAIAGARFAVLKGPLARLHRALGQWMLDVQTREHGYTEVSVPLLVRGDAMLGTGQLPKFADDSFHTTDDRWLIPTAEVSLTNLVREQILPEANLPLRFAALTPCFRQEAGSAGKDTRGLIRQHQFDKVELVTMCVSNGSAAEHERLTAHAEAILDQLHLPYRRMLLCTGDMGFSARKTWDLEVWLPGQNRYREISSCSNCGDFQARRMDARFRPAGAKGTEFVHTLNGSGLAVGRALVAVLENYQRADGSVAVPDVLRPYMGDTETLTPA